LSKKKAESEVEEKKDSEIVIGLYIYYIAKLEKDLGEYKAGKTLDATLMPVIVDRSLDKWENRWFLHDGDKFVGLLPKETDTISIVSAKKVKK